jgi:hypothetical protein
MAESFLSQLVFWSLGYGSLMGFSFAPILMLHAQTWSMRLIILGFSVPTSAFLTSTVTVAFYGYGSFMLALAKIMTQPIFLQSMLHTISLSVSLYCAYVLFEKSLECKSEEVNPSLSEDSDAESENTSEGGTSDTESDAESEEVSDNSEKESETTETAETAESEWRSKANFEGLRNAPPLPE